MVGTFSTSICWPVTRWMFSSRRCSRGSARVMATPSRPARPDPADAVHVGLGGRRHVVVHDVAEQVDVEAAGGDVGGDEQVGAAVAHPAHDPVAALLVEAAVQRLGAVAAAVERLGELVDLVAGAAEDDGGGGRLDVEDAPEGGGLVRAGHDVGGLAHQRRLALGGLGAP